MNHSANLNQIRVSDGDNTVDVDEEINMQEKVSQLMKVPAEPGYVCKNKLFKKYTTKINEWVVKYKNKKQMRSKITTN